MNILQIHHNDCTGGSAIQAYLLSKGLAERGHNVTFLTRQSEKWEEIKRKGDFDVEFAEIKGSLDLKTVSAIRKIVREKGIDIIHVHKGRGLSLALIASLALNVGGVVVHRTVNFPLDIFNSIKYRMKRVDKVIAISGVIKKTLISSGGIDSDNIAVVYPGIVLEKFDPELLPELSLKEDLGIPKGAKVVGVVANVYSYKGHDNIVEAASIILKKYPDTTFLFVGSEGDRVCYESLRKRIAELQLEDNIIFTGFRTDVRDLIGLFDIGVLSSISEGFGAVIVEQMLMKKPVVATTVGGIPEIIEDGVNGLLVSPNEPQQLADKILYLLDNPELAKKMGEVGRESAVSTFSMDEQVDGIEKVYEGVLKKRLKGVL